MKQFIFQTSRISVCIGQQSCMVRPQNGIPQLNQKIEKYNEAIKETHAMKSLLIGCLRSEATPRLTKRQLVEQTHARPAPLLYMKPFDDRSMNNLIQKRLPPYRPVPGVSPQRLGDVQSSMAPRYRKAPLLEKQQNEAPRPVPILKIKRNQLPNRVVVQKL